MHDDKKKEQSINLIGHLLIYLIYYHLHIHNSN